MIGVMICMIIGLISGAVCFCNVPPSADFWREQEEKPWTMMKDQTITCQAGKKRST